MYYSRIYRETNTEIFQCLDNLSVTIFVAGTISVGLLQQFKFKVHALPQINSNNQKENNFYYGQSRLLQEEKNRPNKHMSSLLSPRRRNLSNIDGFT